MAQIVIVSSADAWHSHSSKEIIGVFRTKETAVKRTVKKFKLSEDDRTMLDAHNQTQGRETNYIIDTYPTNQFI
jgi:hypothetical protein